LATYVICSSVQYFNIKITVTGNSLKVNTHVFLTVTGNSLKVYTHVYL